MVESALRREISRAKAPEELRRAMRYSLLAGGKRLRPILVMAAAEACGENPVKVLAAACAVEMVHTYSLIHDDLPTMDNDDLRRGKPTSHKVFGEAMAILTGDALLTQAFECISKNGKGRGHEVSRAIFSLARGAGSGGMVGGQVADLEAEGVSPKNPKARALLHYIHQHKTAALIQASLLAGGILAKASAREERALEKYGLRLGLAFQITDDILDIVGDKKKFGKNGSDRENKKITFPALYGIEKSRNLARSLIRQAKEALKVFGKKGKILSHLADFVIERDR